MPLATQRFKIQMQHSEGHPQVAQVAQHGINLAANFKALLNNKPLTTYNDKGSMAIIGKKIIVDIQNRKCTLKAFFCGQLVVYPLSFINNLSKQS
jgi:NADH dehydrogenase FAD-containing subunit